MPANLQPIYPLAPKDSWGTITAANVAKDGTGTVVTLLTAGANGSRVDTVSIRPLGTNVATVLRIFINNGLVNSTPANNTLFYEITIPGTTVTEVAAQTAIFLQFDNANLPQLVLAPGYKLNLTLGTAIAAGVAVTAVYGDY